MDVTNCPDGLDITASRTGNRVFVHFVNADRTRSATTDLLLSESEIGTATEYQIVDDPTVEVSELNSSQVMQATKTAISPDGNWSLPAASVTAVEIEFPA